jgi:hypothetical protein
MPVLAPIRRRSERVARIRPRPRSRCGNGSRGRISLIAALPRPATPAAARRRAKAGNSARDNRKRAPAAGHPLHVPLAVRGQQHQRAVLIAARTSCRLDPVKSRRGPVRPRRHFSIHADENEQNHKGKQAEQPDQHQIRSLLFPVIVSRSEHSVSPRWLASHGRQLQVLRAVPDPTRENLGVLPKRRNLRNPFVYWGLSPVQRMFQWLIAGDCHVARR